MKQIKEIKNTELWVKEIVETGVGADGRRFMRTRWRKALTGENLGSLKAPNKKILAFKYVESGENPEGYHPNYNIFGKMFGG